MAEINTRDLLISGLAQGQPFDIIKAQQTSEGAGTWHSMWKAAGYPSAGANPPLFTAGAGYVPTLATLGALPIVNPGVGDPLRLLFANLNSTTLGTLIVADRLWACSGFGTVVTTAQTITTPGNLTRDLNGGANGVSCEPWLEVYGAPGATAATWTLTGTDAAGTTGRTWTYAHPANAESVGQMMPMFPGGPTPGAFNIRQPTSFQCSATSGTAGDIGLTIIRRLAQLPMNAANLAAVLDAFALAMPHVKNDSCLMLIVQCSATNTGTLLGHLKFGEA